MRVKLIFTEEILGTSPANTEIYADFIAKKAPDAATTEQEIEDLGVEGVVEKGMTVFPRTEDDIPFLYDYQIKGFFKDACGMLSRIGGTGKDKKKDVNHSAALTSYKKVIDGLIFVTPRKIPIQIKGYVDNCQRPLRAQTAQGERVALAISEACPVGSVIEFEVQCLNSSHEAAVREWLDYGRLRGIGQWRNSGKGRFEWKEIGEEKQAAAAKKK
jgi:hypothetical protein